MFMLAPHHMHEDKQKAHQRIAEAGRHYMWFCEPCNDVFSQLREENSELAQENTKLKQDNDEVRHRLKNLEETVKQMQITLRKQIKHLVMEEMSEQYEREKKNLDT